MPTLKHRISRDVLRSNATIGGPGHAGTPSSLATLYEKFEALHEGVTGESSAANSSSVPAQAFYGVLRRVNKPERIRSGGNPRAQAAATAARMDWVW